jgi:hypothetical protein
MAFDPTPNEAALLAEIRRRESSNNYAARISRATCLQLTGRTDCTASGAYQFIDATWRETAQRTGVGTEYASAAQAPQWVQDWNALYLLRTRGTQPWAAMRRYEPPVEVAVYEPPVYERPIVDLDGDGASTPTPNILDYWYPDEVAPATLGMDWESPTTQLLIAAAVAAVGLLLVRGS